MQSCKNCMFCMNTWHTNADLMFCDLCLGCQNCFGCVSLRKKKFCIFNKQYSEQEYFEIVGKILEHMQSTGEWGEFMPAGMSPFAYNETMAQTYFPLTKEVAEQNGWRWYEDKDSKSHQGSGYEIPDKIEDVKDNILDAVLVCEASSKHYKIIDQELKFYRQFSLPIPRNCPDQRHIDRMMLRNPRKLYDRKCDKCLSAIKTTYSPDRSEKVYCEGCYLAEVY